MGVKYILSRVGRKLGLNPQDTNDRAIMLDWLNEAAREFYDQADMPGCLMEGCYVVNGDQTITMPWNIGKLRGIREASNMNAWHANKMRPRYNQFNWQDQWKNWRIKDKSALQATVTNQSVGVLTVFAVEDPPIVVTLVGPTPTASSMNEIVVMDATQKMTVNTFLTYTSITKDRPNNFDVQLSDVDGKNLSVIPNTEFKAEYQIIDVSLCPWLNQQSSVLDNYMEVLFKRALRTLTEDGDEFPANDCDDILINKIFQLNAEEQSKADLAQAYDAKATRTAARRKDDQYRDTEDCVALVANPHDTVLRRIGTGLRRRWSYYAGRKF